MSQVSSANVFLVRSCRWTAAHPAGVRFILGLLSWWFATLAEGAPVSPEERLEICEPGMVKEQFTVRPGSSQLRALVTRFSGSDGAAQQFGMRVGQSLRDALHEYARQSLDLNNTGLSAANILVRYIPCVIADHDHARQIGVAAGADVVLWGETFCDWRKPRQCQQVEIALKLEGATINSHNIIKESPGAMMTNIVKPTVHVHSPAVDESESWFKTSLTVVNYVGLETTAAEAVNVHRQAELARAQFPKIASRRPRLLFDFMLGIYAYRANRFGLAAELFKKSQDSLSSGLDGISKIYQMIGSSYKSNGDTEKALLAYQQALSACEPENGTCHIESLCGIANVETENGHKRKAAEHYRAALHLSRKYGDRKGEGMVFLGIGFLYSPSKPKRELEFNERALAIFREINDIEHQAIALNNIATYYQKFGDLKKALGLYNETLAIERKLGRQDGEAGTLVNLGNIASEMGHKTQALDFLKRAALLKKQEGELAGWGIALYDAAIIYYELGDNMQALSLYEEALPVFKKQSLGRQALILDCIAETLEVVGRAEDAIARYQDAANAYLLPNPPSRKEAQHSLLLAFNIALHKRLFDQAINLIKTMQTRGIAANYLVALRDRLVTAQSAGRP